MEVRTRSEGMQEGVEEEIVCSEPQSTAIGKKEMDD